MGNIKPSLELSHKVELLGRIQVLEKNLVMILRLYKNNKITMLIQIVLSSALQLYVVNDNLVIALIQGPWINHNISKMRIK